MNGATKFHKVNGPAFNPGEVWYSCDGAGIRVEIVSVRPYPHRHGNAGEILGISDYGVTYMQRNGTTHEKDGWNFQVRYFHQADKDL